MNARSFSSLRDHATVVPPSTGPTCYCPVEVKTKHGHSRLGIVQPRMRAEGDNALRDELRYRALPQAR